MGKLEILATIFVVLSLGVTEGLIVSFCILCLAKWNALELYDIYRKKWMPIRCEFCLAFWLSLIMTIVFQCFKGFHLYLFLAPLVATSINFTVLKGE